MIYARSETHFGTTSPDGKFMQQQFCVVALFFLMQSGCSTHATEILFLFWLSGDRDKKEKKTMIVHGKIAFMG